MNESLNVKYEPSPIISPRRGRAQSTPDETLAPPKKLFKTENEKPKPNEVDPCGSEEFSSEPHEEVKDPNKRERRLMQNRKSALKCR